MITQRGRPYHPLALHNYTPVLRSMPADEMPASLTEAPTVCLEISEKLVPYVLGLLEIYRWPDKLSGTAEQVESALGVFQDLMYALMTGNCLPMVRDIRINSCNLEVTYDGESWIAIGSLSECATGEQGPPGKSVRIRNNGTLIEWRPEDEATLPDDWTAIVNLDDLKGDDGAAGQSVELRHNETTNAIEVRRSATPAPVDWTQLLALDGLKGDDGASVELRWNAGNLEWRQDDFDPDWQVLVTGDLLRGPQGIQGIQGPAGPQGPAGDTIYQVVDPVVTAAQEASGIAAYVTRWWDELWNDLLDLLDLSVDAVQFTSKIIAYVVSIGGGAAAGPGPGALAGFAVGSIIDQFISLGEEMWDLGTDMIRTTANSLVVDNFECLLYCEVLANGWTKSTMTNWRNAIAAEHPANPGALLWSAGTVGITENSWAVLAKVGMFDPDGTVEARCNCGFDWSADFDFSAGLQGWQPATDRWTTVYSNGAFRSVLAFGYEACAATVSIPDGTTLTRVEVYGTALNQPLSFYRIVGLFNKTLDGINGTAPTSQTGDNFVIDLDVVGLVVVNGVTIECSNLGDGNDVTITRIVLHGTGSNPFA